MSVFNSLPSTSSAQSAQRANQVRSSPSANQASSLDQLVGQVASVLHTPESWAGEERPAQKSHQVPQNQGLRWADVARGVAARGGAASRDFSGWCEVRRSASSRADKPAPAWSQRSVSIYGVSGPSGSSSELSRELSLTPASGSSGETAGNLSSGASLDGDASSSLCVSESSTAQDMASMGSSSSSGRPGGDRVRSKGAWKQREGSSSSASTSSSASSRYSQASRSSSLRSSESKVLSLSSVELLDCSSEVTQSRQGPLLWDRSALHSDDIHALLQTRLGGEEGLFTGGKDGRVMFTTLDGCHSGEVIAAPRGRGQHWVTALAVNAAGQFALGRRSGAASLYDLNEEVRLLAEAYLVAVGNDCAKARNQDRIHSMSWVSAVSGELQSPVLLAGLNGRMMRFDRELRSLAEIECDARAWVYGSVELAPERLLCIEGAGLAMHTFEETRWRRYPSFMAKMHGQGDHGLTEEEFVAQGLHKGQKLISAIHPVPGQAQEVVISQFDGTLSLLNLQYASRIRATTVGEVSRWVLNDYGHDRHLSRRVWQALPLSQSTWVAATDDGTLPLIDWRMRRVAQRLSTGGQRVSCVATSPDPGIFFAVSCATDPRDSGGAHLQAFDSRRA